MLLSSPSSIFPGVLATPLTLFIQSNKSLEYVGMTFYWKFSHGTYLSILSVNFVSIAGNPLLHFFDHVNAKKKKHFTWLLKTKEGTSLFIESLPSVISDNLTHIKCKKKQKKKNARKALDMFLLSKAFQHYGELFHEQKIFFLHKFEELK